MLTLANSHQRCLELNVQNSFLFPQKIQHFCLCAFRSPSQGPPLALLTSTSESQVRATNRWTPGHMPATSLQRSPRNWFSAFESTGRQPGRELVQVLAQPHVQQTFPFLRRRNRGAKESHVLILFESGWSGTSPTPPVWGNWDLFHCFPLACKSMFKKEPPSGNPPQVRFQDTPPSQEHCSLPCLFCIFSLSHHLFAG